MLNTLWRLVVNRAGLLFSAKVFRSVLYPGYNRR